MKIDILDLNRLISVNKLEQVTSPGLFSNNGLYNPEGILSSEIFGIGKSERRQTFAWIDLNGHYIHPHIYKNVLGRMFRDIQLIVSGQKRFIVRNGVLEHDDNGWTGLQNFYKHYDEINWKKTKTNDSDNRKLLDGLSKNEVFIDKLIVCPPAYRDVQFAGTVDNSDYVNPLNGLYQNIIKSVSITQEGGLFVASQYATQSNIQTTLCDIMNHFESQISKKQGLIRKYLMGKSVDYGARLVISAPTYNHERFEDNIVDLEHSAVPISSCCSLFYPFIESWLKNFFTREIINDPNMVSYYDYETKREYTAVLKEPEIQFSDKNIRKMINDYCMNPDNRFRVINVEVQIPNNKKKAEYAKAAILLKGKKILPNNASEVLNRPMTITDLLYLASVDVCEKRHVMVSRYPVGTDKGIFFSRIRVQSTKNHIQLIYNGKEYKFYPDINLDLNHDLVGVQFIDTLVMSNSHLDGMGELHYWRPCKTLLIAGILISHI